VDENTRVLTVGLGVRALCEHLLDPARTLPVLVLTCRGGSPAPALKVREVRERVGPDVPIYVVRGLEAERVLAEGLPERFEVRNGAARIYWPGLTVTDTDSHEHPVILGRRGEYGERELARIEEELFPAVDFLEPELPAEKGLAFAEQCRRIAERRLHRSEQQARALRVELRRLRRREREQDGEDPEGDGEGEGLLDVDVLLDDEPLPGIGGELSERLEGLIGEQHRKALGSPAGLEDWPLGRYSFGPAFFESVEQRTIPTSLERIAWASAMIACGRAPHIPGLEVHPLTTGVGGGQILREDGAKGWRAVLQHRAGGPRLHYWTLPDGSVEFDAVGDHELTP
jgi:hypothetical protein